MTMRSVRPGGFVPSGELRDRIEASLGRLERDDFQPDRVYRSPEYDWPGDQEGRTLLALVMLAQASGREPRYWRELVGRIGGALNEQGYFGKMLPPGETDEQQLSGNSWFLRALCEYYEWRREGETLRRIETLARNLLLPAAGRYRLYPAAPEQRAVAGEASGTLLEGVTNGWRLSTDIGCAFIMLDGASHAYRLLGWPELGALIEEMIAAFVAVDFIGVSMQTHATLSGLRGMLRYAEDTGSEALVRKAQDLFALYTGYGMTENYANYNWFRRPEWTEPCAVVDSFLASVDLWRLTGEPLYLDAAHHIYYNGIGHGQRPNGGFGCDCCSGAHEPYLYPLANVFEAWWCCTMRGGDGLARAAAYALLMEDGTVTVPFFHPGEARLEGPGGERLEVRITTGYPLEGWLRIESVAGDKTDGPDGAEADGSTGSDGWGVPDNHASAGSLQWRLYLPEWVERGSARVLIDGDEAEVRIEQGFAIVDGFENGLELRFEIGLRSEPLVGHGSLAGGYRSFRHGPLVLGLRNAEEEVVPGDGCRTEPGPRAGEYRLIGSSALEAGDSVVYDLQPFHELFRLPEEVAVQDRKQILFRMAP